MGVGKGVERYSMGTEEKIDDVFLKEIEVCMGGEKLHSLPIAINVEPDDMPDIERWKTHE